MVVSIIISQFGEHYNIMLDEPIQNSTDIPFNSR